MSYSALLRFRKTILLCCLVISCQFIAVAAFADNIVWNFTALTSAAASSSNANVPASGCTAAIGNSYGTVSSFINSTSASNTYSGFSAGGNIGNAVNTGTQGNATFNSGSSPYISFTLVPNSGYSITITGISFGSRSTGTGPQAYAISTSVGGFGTSVASGTLPATSSWALYSPTFTSTTGAAGSPIEVRIYAYGGVGSAGSGTENWRIDDINFTVTVSASNAAPAFTGGTTQTLNVCQNSSAFAINSLLAISDANSGQTETWTVASAPTHGSLSGFPVSTTSTGGTLTPSGLTYTPTAGYTGSDAFTIQISDGIATATTAVSVAVNPLPSTPAAITGTATVCEASTTTLSETTTGGFWTSSNTSVATVNSSGIVSGVAAGTATISYSVANGCGTAYATAVVTVNPLPSAPGAISGTLTVCESGTTSLSASPSGGTWSSVSTSVATISSTGVVSGVTAGTSVVSYTVSNSCGTIAATAIVTVNPLPATPAALSGTFTVCQGGTTALGETSTGGAWSSTATSIASVGSTGVVSGIAAGTATISYTVTNGCGSSAALAVVTVNPLPSTPAAITGGATACVSSTTTLSETSTDGIWSSSNSAVATVGSTGVVSGVAAGTATISYTISNSCGAATASIVVTINPLPDAGSISGLLSLSVGGTTSLTNGATGGVWSSVSTSVATVGSTGVVSGVALGTSVISYTVTNACGVAAATVTVTVNPVTFTRGNLVVLRTGDGSAPLSSAATPIGVYEYTTGGTATGFSIALPSSGSTKITNSGSASSEGFMTLSAERDRLVIEGYNAAAGTASVVSTSAATSPRELFTINSAGVYAMAVSSTTAYSANNMRSGTASGTDYFSAGTASSAPNGIVYLNSSTSLATTPTNTRMVQIFNGQLYFSASSSPFLGVAKMGTGLPTSSGQTATLVNSTNASSAYGFSFSPDGTTLYIADDAAGIIKYTGSGSSYSLAYNVNSTPVRGLVVDYSGSNPVLYATTSTLTNGNTIIKVVDGGAGSTATTIATAPANTAFRGVQFAPSCFASITLAGAATICSGSSSSITFKGNPNGVVTYNINGGSPQTATIGNNGIVTVSTGSLTTTSVFNLVSISTTACSSVGLSGSVTVTVNPVPTAITGTTVVCSGATTTLSDVGSGTWSTSDAGIATIGSSTGVVNAIAPGTVTITYALTCGTVNAVVTVNPLPATPAAIGGTFVICVGSATTLSESVSGGVWASADPSVATVGSTGVVTGVTSGITTVSYTISNSCGSNFVVAPVTVNSNPAAISGSLTVCEGATATLSDAGGGSWASSSTNATIGSASGILAGVVAGNATISYTLGNGCFVTAVATINAAPGAISGTMSACVGATSTLTDAGGGTWAASNANVSIGSSTGLVTGLSAGTSVISYTLPDGCFITSVFTVNQASSGTITGSATICNGSNATYVSTVSGGTWSSSNTSVIAIVGSTGVATGVSLGSANLTYTITNSCGTYTTLQPVSVVIAPPSFSITPALVSLCPSSPAQLITAIGDTIYGSVSVTNAATTFVEHLNAPDSTSVAVSGIPAGATITSVSIFLNVAAKSTAQQRDNVFNLRAPNGNILNLDNGKGSSISGIGFSNVNISSAGTTAMTTATLVAGIPYIATLASGAPTSGSFTATQYRSNVTAWSGLYSVPNGTWTLITDNTFNATEDTFKSWTLVINYSVNPSVTWTSTTGLFSNSGGTTAYTGGSTANVYALPATSTSYTATATIGTCSKTAIVPVNVNSSLYVPAISGPSSVCSGSSMSLSDSTTGGIWSSGSPSIATVGSSSGIVTGVAVGSATITYTYTSGSCSGFAVKVVSVNPLPAVSPISGTTNLCLGSTITATLNDAATGTHSWSSSNSGVATIDISSGLVTAQSVGTSIITYTYNDGTCSNFATTSLVVANTPTTVFVTPSVGSICPSGPALNFVASGGTTPASSTTASGAMTFAIGNTAPGVSTGLVVSGIPTGATVTGIAVNFNATESFDGDLELNLKAPNASVLNLFSSGTTNNGPNFVNTTISSAGITPIPNSGAGAPWTGVWAANAASGSTIGSSTTPPTTTSWGPLMASNPNGTWTLVGRTNFAGNTATLTSWSITISYDYQAPVTWSSVSGLYTNSGATTAYTGTPASSIYALPVASTVYTVTATNGACSASTTVAANVNSVLYVPVINGASNVCIGAGSVFSDTLSGGVWSSGNSAVATVGSASGVVTGISAGAANITYTYSSGTCSGFAVKSVSVNALPAVSPIAGSSSACIGTPATLTNTTAGGTWSSSVPAVATIGTTGILTPVSQGTTTISYTVSDGVCSNTATLGVNAYNVPGVVAVSPSSVTVCSSGPAAQLTATGGMINGSATFTTSVPHSLSSGVLAICPLTVSGIPAGAIINSVSVTFNATQSGGGWNSDDIFNIQAPNGHTFNLVNAKGGSGSTQGFVNTTISSTATVAIPPTGAPYTGTYNADSILGTGLSPYASDSSTWSSLYSTGSPNGVWNFVGAYIFTSGTTTVNNWSLTLNYSYPTNYSWAATTGLFTDSLATTAYSGAVAGSVYTQPSANTVYTLTATNGSCTSSSTVSVSVNPSPAAITGPAGICLGADVTYADATAAGIWSSSNPAVAAIGSLSGIASGLSVGTATITYTLSTGCYVTRNVTVNALPDPISGLTTVCVAATTSLSDAGSGTWSSSDITKATIGSATGLVTGIGSGNPKITYTLSTGCFTTTVLTVNPVPAALLGSLSTCVGLNVTLTDATVPGIWSSGNTGIANIGSASGIVTGVAAGIADITYSLPTGCFAKAAFTVNPLPAPISGSGVVCVGASSTLVDAGAGTWSSSDIALADIGSATGILTGIGSGNPVITYTLPTGCIATAVVTVNALPSPISGGSQVCLAASLPLSDAGGGTWTSSDFSIASVGSLTGLVSGVSVGSAVITYTLPSGCLATLPVSVNALPAPVAGIGTICSGASVILSDDTLGGTWSSSNTTIAAVGTSSGVLSGVSGGSAVISYTIGNGCFAVKFVTVNASPAPISGSPFGCTGATTPLTDVVTGGLWTSSDISVADVGSSSGLFTGITAGNAVITYTLPGGCYVSMPVTVNTSPAPISGTFLICVGQTTALSDISSGGTWSSGDLSVATVDGSGLVTGISGGSSVISYSVSTGCIAAALVSVNALPTAYTMTGGGALCTGGSGVPLGLSGSDLGVNYQLYMGGVPVGAAVTGTGAALNFGTFTAAGTYSVIATNSATSCTANMTGAIVINVSTPPTVYTLYGGGSYCYGGSGVPVGIIASTPGISYQLYNYSTQIGAPVMGTGAGINFGLQSLAGPYNVIATDIASGCTANMISTVTVSVNPLPVPNVVSGGGAYCSGGTGVHVYLNSSQIGVNYQLLNSGSPVGGTVSGTTAALDFGLQTATGSYSIVATNPATGCFNTMSGLVTVTTNPLPAVFAITSGGGYCPGGSGAAVGLSGSSVGVQYQLYCAGVAVGTPVIGTGSSITFGLQTLAGVYTVVATNPATGCTNTMSGTSTIFVNSLPAVYTVTGGGGYCLGGSGVAIGLNSSQLGVRYQLYNGVSTVGGPVLGTGTALSFGSAFTVAGAYTVVATNIATGCSSAMFGSASVAVNPLPVAFSVSSTATSYCSGGAGVHILLSGSVAGVNYYLYNSSTLTSGASGTGSALDFGPVFGAGTYTVVAKDMSTACSSTMSGSAIISVNPVPAAFSVTGGGNYCSGSSAPVIGLSNSAAGVSYQLSRSGIPLGAPVAGNGLAISFGSQSAPGSYTVAAVNTATGCVNTMTGSASVSVLPLPVVYNVLGGGSYCSGGTGLHISLPVSDIGITYQLYNGAPVGAPVAGSGSALDFGIFTAAGNYTIVGTNASTGCNSIMAGSAVVTVNPLPALCNVTGGGHYCSGDVGRLIGIDNSVIGVNYQLYNGTTVVGSVVAGTGAALSFGAQTSAGTFTVKAINATTGCINSMTGSTVIVVDPLPSGFNVTGGGSYCMGGSGMHVGLAGSTVGVTYQLYRDGVLVPGALVAGTGFELDFGLQTVAGTYTVVGTTIATSCSRNMAGSAIVSVNMPPAAFAISGGGSYCLGGGGRDITLSGSQAGIVYQLYVSAAPVGAPVSGTGGVLDFGAQTVAGSYTVMASNPASSCTAAMTGSANILVNPLPPSYIISGGGSYCPGGSGVDLALSGSTTGVSYQLYFGASASGLPVAGTGAPLDFGLKTGAGSYSVVATYVASGCSASMTGSALVGINSLPTPFNVTGGGSYCPSGTGVHVGLSGSVVGTSYQLYHNSIAVGGLYTGSGGSVDFGPQLATGTYTVIATSMGTGCTGIMNGSATVEISPLPSVHLVTGGGSYCDGGIGVHIGLDMSETGTYYQLIRASAPVGAPRAGTGAALDFGAQAVPGYYTITATSTATGCTSVMGAGVSVIVDPLPIAYTVSGGGSYCAGTNGLHINLSGSQVGTMYQLFNGSVASGSPVAGTGTMLDFGLQTVPGSYVVVATAASTCTNTMTGATSISVDPIPSVFTVSGGGAICPGSIGLHIFLSSSASGVHYKLYNGGVFTGIVLPGTGSSLDFGPINVAGSYTVEGINSTTSCSADMVGSALITVNSLPANFTLTSSGTAFCSGGTGIDIKLNGSSIGTNYQLYKGAAVGTPLAGTGAPLDFGYMVDPGTYTVVATNSGTSCSAIMTGAIAVVVNPAPPVFSVTGGGSFCLGGPGVAVGLSGSASGIIYQLRNTFGPVGTAVTGTGGPIDFGLQPVAGTYNVTATNPATGCTASMIGSPVVSVNVLPSVYNVSGGGSFCAGGSGVHVLMIGSQLGIQYQLMNGSSLVQTQSGTGTTIDFGLQTIAGHYTVVASNTATGCSRIMNGAADVSVNALPVAFAVTGGGNYCVGTSGVHIGLAASAGGISYQLYRSGVSVGASIGGTGAGIDFGLQTTAGTYSVKATDPTSGCSGVMSGSPVIAVSPLPHAYHVTGSGSYCAGGTGRHIGLDGSEAGVNYQLYYGATAIGSALSGSGASVDFGLQSLAGGYKVYATNAVTSCGIWMVDSALVSVLPAVVPFVDITTGLPSDSVCSGHLVTFSALPVNGGPTPAYQWSVNGVAVAAASNYSYIPVNGDVVSLTMASSAACPALPSVGNSRTMTVLTEVAPSLVVYADPGSIVCKNTTVTLTALPSFGGTAPVYAWYNSGAPVSTAATYTFVPAGGEDVYCVMTSNYSCRLGSAATSNHEVFDVQNITSPTVTIAASPDSNIAPGQTLKLTASVTNGGPTPVYQWSVNGAAINGATNQSYTSSSYVDNDLVTCDVISSGVCAGFSGSKSIKIHVMRVGVQPVLISASDIIVIPNPTTGRFTVKGSLGAIATAGPEDVLLELTNTLGQVVYSKKILVKNNSVDETVSVEKYLPNGMYLLSLRSATETKVFHLVIEQ